MASEEKVFINPVFVNQPAHPDGVRLVLSRDEALAAIKELEVFAGENEAPLPYNMVGNPGDAIGATVNPGLTIAAIEAALREAGLL